MKRPGHPGGHRRTASIKISKAFPKIKPYFLTGRNARARDFAWTIAVETRHPPRNTFTGNRTVEPEESGPGKVPFLVDFDPQNRMLFEIIRKKPS